MFYSPIQIQKLVDEVAAVGKPFLTVIQSFGGGERHTRTPTPQVCIIVLPTSTHTHSHTHSHTLAFPTLQEVRVMVYLSLLRGSSGFIYFIYSPRSFPYSTSLWSECRTLALEALDLSSSLLSEKPPLDVSKWKFMCCVWGRGWQFV